jgi:hypothetical protein
VGSRARGHALVFIWESGGAHSHASDCADCASHLWANFWTKLAALRMAWPVLLQSTTKSPGLPGSFFPPRELCQVVSLPLDCFPSGWSRGQPGASDSPTNTELPLHRRVCVLYVAL